MTLYEPDAGASRHHPPPFGILATSMPKKPPKKGRPQQNAVHARQREFFDRLAPEGQWQTALNHLENIRVVIKDLEGRFVWVTDNAPGRHGLTPDEMVGRHDFDINPGRLAQIYCRDDGEVMRRGRPLLGKAEVSFNELGLLDWYIVNKFPLWDREGAVIGLIATIQKHPGLSHLSALGGEIRAVVEHIQAHLGEPLRISALARLAGISARQIERRFHSATGMSPTDFIVRARLAEACRLLRETASAIGQIALETGFYDQSALTRLFRKHLGMTPGEFRRPAPGWRKPRDLGSTI